MRGFLLRLISCAGFAGSTVLLLVAPAQALGLRYSVVFDDPQGFYTSFYEPIRTHVLAGGQLWGNYLAGNADLEVKIGFGSGPSLPRATGRSLTSSFVANRGGYNVYEQGAAGEINQGIDPNGAEADIEINFGDDYLRNELWFDPEPYQRMVEVPIDRTDALSVVLHELGHAFAFNGFLDPFTGARPAGGYQSTFDEQTSFQNGNFFFNGPRATALYGGPVPLTYGNYQHLGNDSPRPGSDLIPDMMNGVVYYRGTRYNISALDLAVAQDVGLQLTPAAVPTPALLPGLLGLGIGLIRKRKIVNR